MTREEKYDKVNRCENLNDLANIILSFADNEGMINGRAFKWTAKEMAIRCLNFSLDDPSQLTREFGIRQQAMYIKFFENI